MNNGKQLEKQIPASFSTLPKKVDWKTVNNSLIKKRIDKASLKESKSKLKKKEKKVNRTRKSQCQKDALWNLYKSLNGATPSHETIAEYSEELNLKENQIYKWFWDTKKKVDEDNFLA